MSHSFTNLECWKNARILVKSTFAIIDEHEDFKRNFPLRDQLVRASISVMNNIAEGYGRRSSKDAQRFYEYAISSCMEVESMTYILQDVNPSSNDAALELRKLASVTKAMTINFRKSFKHFSANKSNIT